MEPTTPPPPGEPPAAPSAPRLAPKVAARRAAAGSAESAARGPSAGARVRAAWERHPLHAFLAHRRRITLLRQLSDLLRAGQGVPIALATIARYAGSRRQRQRIEGVAARIDAGSGLVDALRLAGLDPVSIELLAAAEETGTLDRFLPGLVARLDGAQSARWRLLSILLYPCYVAALVVFLGPAMSFGEAMRRGASLDQLPRVYALGVGRNLLAACGLLLLAVALPLLPSLLGIEERWDRLRLRLPLLGALHRDLYAGRLLSVLGASLAAGTNVLRAIELAVIATGSPALARGGVAAMQQVAAGGTLSDAIEELRLLDPPTLGSLAVAERTGDLDTVPYRLGAELAVAAARRLRALMMTVIAIALVLLVLKIVGGVVASFSGTMDALDKSMDQLIQEGR
ncbi:MAG: hypothetical protein EXR72_13635 [Myxococcales bacterium]|nr:hypothetical protein [Myxococcales bacterium]